MHSAAQLVANETESKSIDALEINELEIAHAAPFPTTKTIREARRYPESVRDKIRNAQLVDKLLKFIAGDLDMTGKQVDAALKLLNKTIPDLKAIEVRGTITHKAELTRESLDQQLRSLGLDPTAEWKRLQNQPVIEGTASAPVLETAAPNPEHQHNQPVTADTADTVT